MCAGRGGVCVLGRGGGVRVLRLGGGGYVC